MCRSGAALRKAQLPLTCKFGDTVEVVVEISPVVERAFLYDPTGDIANLEQLRFEDFSFELVLVSDENEMQDDSDRSTDIAAAVAASVPAELTHCYTALQGWTLKLNSHSCGQRDASTPPLDSESEDSNPTFSLGEEVWVVVEGEHKSKGFVRFMGPIEYMDGIFFGIELTDDSGCNNGTIDGREYFRCPQKHGIFVRPEDVTKGEHMLWPFKRMPIQLSFCGQLEAPSNYNKSVQCSSIFLQAKYGHAVLQSKLWHMPRTPSTSSALTRQTNPVLLDIMPQSSPCAVGLHVAPLCSPGQASFVDVRVSNIHRSSVFQRLLSSTSSGAAVAGVSIYSSQPTPKPKPNPNNTDTNTTTSTSTTTTATASGKTNVPQTTREELAAAEEAERMRLQRAAEVARRVELETAAQFEAQRRRHREEMERQELERLEEARRRMEEQKQEAEREMRRLEQEAEAQRLEIERVSVDFCCGKITCLIRSC